MSNTTLVLNDKNWAITFGIRLMQRHFFFAFQKDSKYTDLVVTPLLKVNAYL